MSEAILMLSQSFWHGKGDFVKIVTIMSRGLGFTLHFRHASVIYSFKYLVFTALFKVKNGSTWPNNRLDFYALRVKSLWGLFKQLDRHGKKE